MPNSKYPQRYFIAIKIENAIQSFLHKYFMRYKRCILCF